MYNYELAPYKITNINDCNSTNSNILPLDINEFSESDILYIRKPDANLWRLLKSQADFSADSFAGATIFMRKGNHFEPVQ